MGSCTCIVHQFVCVYIFIYLITKDWCNRPKHTILHQINALALNTLSTFLGLLLELILNEGCSNQTLHGQLLVAALKSLSKLKMEILAKNRCHKITAVTWKKED